MSLISVKIRIFSQKLFLLKLLHFLFAFISKLCIHNFKMQTFEFVLNIHIPYPGSWILNSFIAVSRVLIQWYSGDGVSRFTLYPVGRRLYLKILTAQGSLVTACSSLEPWLGPKHWILSQMQNYWKGHGHWYCLATLLSTGYCIWWLFQKTKGFEAIAGTCCLKYRANPGQVVLRHLLVLKHGHPKPSGYRTVQALWSWDLILWKISRGIYKFTPFFSTSRKIPINLYPFSRHLARAPNL